MCQRAAGAKGLPGAVGGSLGDVSPRPVGSRCDCSRNGKVRSTDCVRWCWALKPVGLQLLRGVRSPNVLQYSSD